MVKRYRRRGSKGQWIPTIGAFTGGLTLTKFNDEVLEAVPFVFGDEPPTQAKLSTTFATNSDPYRAGAFAAANRGPNYLIKRIVGSTHIGIAREPAAYAQGVMVTAGLVVDRTDEDGVLQNLNAWYPLTEEAEQKRWLWRRTWRISNDNDIYDFPFSNAEYGDVRSGPHVDMKCMARVTFEERLFFILAARTVVTIPDGIETTIGAYTHLRLFGSLIRPDNR